MSCWRYSPAPQTGLLPGPPGSYLSGVSAHKFNQIKYLSLLFQQTSTVERRSCVVYAQDNNSLPVWSIFCHQLTNSYLHQFSTIFSGNCINLEMQIDSTKSRLQEFDTVITDRLNDEAHIIIEGEKSQPYDWSDHPFDEDIDFVEVFHSVVSNSEIKEADEEVTPDTYDDWYLNMELAVPRGDNPNPQYAKVTKRLRDADGIPIGTANEIPILDSCMYEVEYQNSTKVHLGQVTLPRTYSHK